MFGCINVMLKLPPFSGRIYGCKLHFVEKDFVTGLTAVEHVGPWWRQIYGKEICEGEAVALVDAVNLGQRNTEPHAVHTFGAVVDHKLTPAMSVQKESACWWRLAFAIQRLERKGYTS
jgi:hypothetical protein